jgi:hypothetical protein
MATISIHLPLWIPDRTWAAINRDQLSAHTLVLALQALAHA